MKMEQKGELPEKTLKQRERNGPLVPFWPLQNADGTTPERKTN